MMQTLTKSESPWIKKLYECMVRATGAWRCKASHGIWTFDIRHYENHVQQHDITKHFSPTIQLCRSQKVLKLYRNPFPLYAKICIVDLGSWS